MLLFPPLSPSPPHSCPAEVFHTLHPYGRLVQPCPAWSTTHSLQKEQELKPEINVNRRIINQGYVSRANTRALQHREGILPSLLFSPAWGSLSVLPLHSSLFLNFIMWSSQECFPLSLQSLPRLLALSLSTRSKDHSFSQLFCMGECLCVYVLVHVHYCVMSRSSVLPLHWNRDLNCLFHLPENNTQSPHVNTE